MHHSPLLDTDVQEDGYNCYDLITACESIGDHQPHFQKYPLEDILDKITNEIHQLQVTDKVSQVMLFVRLCDNIWEGNNGKGQCWQQ